MKNNYQNLIFVKHEGSDKPYLFQMPMQINLGAGQKVFCKTYAGSALGTCLCNNFIVDETTAQSISAGVGASTPLKYVTGLAQKSAEYIEQPFESELPF